MADDKKIALFEEIPVPKAVVTMAVPTVISSLVMVIYNLADTYFVSMLNNSVENAAVTLAAPILLAFNAVNNLFGVGSSSLMSRALGKKEYDTVRKTSAFGFYCSLLFGLLISVFCLAFNKPLLTILGTDSITFSATASYLKWTVIYGAVPSILNVVLAYFVRSEGAALHASIGTMSGCLLNIILDPLFILPIGLNMGAAGAGLATFISNCTACCYFLVLIAVKHGKTYVCINPRMFSMNRGIASGVFAVGIPAAIQNLLNVTGMTVLNNFTSGYGADAVAAMGIAQKISIVPMYIALGISQGIMPLVSYNYSSGNIARMKKTVTFAAKATTVLMVLAAAGCYFGAEGLMKLFIDNSSIVNYGKSFLRGLSIAQPFLNIDFMAVGVFQATGMGSLSLIFAVLRKIVLEIPAIVLLNKIFPLYGLAYAQAAAEIILAAAAAVVLIKIFKKLEKNVKNGI